MVMVQRTSAAGRRRWLIAAIALIVLSTFSARGWSDGWVDRIEGDLAVIIHEPTAGSDIWVEEIVPLADLYPGVHEGDVIVDGVVDRDATVAVLKRILVLRRRLLGD